MPFGSQGTPSQAQTGLGSFLTGLAGGISDAQKAKQKAAYDAALYGQKLSLQNDRQDFQSKENDLNRSVKERLASGGGGGSYLFGEIYGLDRSDPRYNISVTTKQAPMVAASSFNATKPTAAEQKATSDAGQMSELGGNLGAQWKEFGFGEGSASQALGGKVAQYAPGQVSQRIAPEKYTEFDNTKKILSETALRIATGAATNPSEVAVYKSMLPEPGDSPTIAVNKINNFFTRAGAKGDDTSRRMEVQGLKSAAAAHRKQTGERLAKMKAQMLADFASTPEPKPAPAPGPAGSGGPKIKKNPDGSISID